MTRAHWFIAAALAGACATAAACEADSKQSATQVAAPGDVLDEALMVALAQAKNFHHKADVYLRDANVDAAIESVREILAIPFPAGAPEAHDVLLDARARLGKLLLGKGELAEAMQVVDDGIASSSRESYFLANVYTVRGEIFEAMDGAADDEIRAKQYRKDAIEAFDTSIRINRQVQRELAKEMGL